MNESFEAMVYKKSISICVAAITLQIFTIFSSITGTSMPSQAPPVVFQRTQTNFEFIDICIQASRFTLHQCTEINRFVCKIPAFRTKTIDLFLFLVLPTGFEATSKVIPLVNM